MHDLRRTAVRNLERSGVSRSTATTLTGHLTETIYKRYAIVNAADLTEGIAKLGKLHGQPSTPTVVAMPVGQRKSEVEATSAV